MRLKKVGIVVGACVLSFLVAFSTEGRSQSNSCPLRGDSNFLLPIWSERVEADPELDPAIEESCKVGCWGFCPQIIDPTIDHQKADLILSCRKEWTDDCNSLKPEIQGSNLLLNRENWKCILIGGDACFDEIRNKTIESGLGGLLYHKIACHSGSKAACQALVAIQNQQENALSQYCKTDAIYCPQYFAILERQGRYDQYLSVLAGKCFDDKSKSACEYLLGHMQRAKTKKTFSRLSQKIDQEGARQLARCEKDKSSMECQFQSAVQRKISFSQFSEAFKLKN
jgi:hypothetical protein